MSTDDNNSRVNSDSIIPKVVTVFRHLLFAETIAHDQIKQKNNESDVADEIIGWFEKGEQQQIKADREEIKRKLKEDGGATLDHNKR